MMQRSSLFVNPCMKIFFKCSFIRPFVLWSVIFVFMVFSLGSLSHLSVLSKIGSFPTPPDAENLRVNKTQKFQV